MQSLKTKKTRYQKKKTLERQNATGPQQSLIFIDFYDSDNPTIGFYILMDFKDLGDQMIWFYIFFTNFTDLDDPTVGF